MTMAEIKAAGPESLKHIEDALQNIVNVAAHCCPTKSKEEILDYIQIEGLRGLAAFYCYQLAEEMKKDDVQTPAGV